MLVYKIRNQFLKITLKVYLFFLNFNYSNSDKCFCGNSYGKYGNSSKCNTGMKCKGSYNDQICGDKLVNSVYDASNHNFNNYF